MKPVIATLLFLVALPLNAQPSDPILLNANLRADGIPPISKAVAERVGAYSEFRGHGFADWHPTRREMLITHRAADANVPQLYRIEKPGGAIERITDFPEPINRRLLLLLAGRIHRALPALGLSLEIDELCATVE